MEHWFIEGYFDGDDVMRRLKVYPLPFRMGRQPDLELTLDSNGLSRTHAELYEDGGLLMVRDLDSTNGTFVNHKIVRGERALRHGDVVHLGDAEFRVVGQDKRANDNATGTMMLDSLQGLSNRLPTGTRELRDLIDQGAAIAAYQSIVQTDNDSVYAWEVLGRGNHPELPQSPGELFRIAESAGFEVELSEMLRVKGLQTAVACSNVDRLFLNTHPKELKDPKRLLASLQRLQEQFGGRALVLEIHEQGVTDLDAMASLRNALERMDIELAYDDFGAGQARLLELIEAPPAYLKFDMAFIRNIDRAPEAKIDMVQALIAMARKMNIRTLAEGASSEAEANACRELGFDFIQGYFYGKPGALPAVDG
ncbi:MAG TPA: EAL domain-containing protein [Pseudomonadales bacterium]